MSDGAFLANTNLTAGGWWEAGC